MTVDSALALPLRAPLRIGASATTLALKLVYAVVMAPEYFFLAALTAMLFRPPDLQTFPIDRIAFVALLAVTSLHLLFRRERIQTYSPTWPMLALLLLGVWGVLDQPYAAPAWSLLAAKWVVPFVMFHLAGLVFAGRSAQRMLEWFSILVLLYLSLTAAFFLLDLKLLIFPRFILDEGIGIHSERARGPFLQAVANGVCLTVLGILALYSFQRRRLRGILAGVLFVCVPVALVATKTRAVWLAACVCVAAILLFGRGRSRIIAFVLVVTAALAMGMTQLLQAEGGEFRERLQDRSPVEFRLEMYRAGWQMLMEQPLFGWGSDAQIQPEIERRIHDFHPEYYVFHNTYLELGVQRGLFGLGLYAWLFVALFRLGARTVDCDPDRQIFGAGFGFFWRLALCAYLINASAVVMNYQFLNGYLFTVAGILAAQQCKGGPHHFANQGGRSEDCVPV